MEIDGIRSVTSTAQQSSGTIAVEFELNRNIDEAMQEIQNQINQVTNLLPIDLFPPTVRKSNPEDQPILWLALTTDDPNTRPIDMMILRAELSLRPVRHGARASATSCWAATSIPRCASGSISNKLEKYNLTSDDVDQRDPAGARRDSGRARSRTPARNTTSASWARRASPEEFGKITDQQPRRARARTISRTQLKDVAKVEEGIADVRKISRFNGQSAVGLGIIKQHGSNAVEVANAVRAKLQEIQPLHPASTSSSTCARTTRASSSSR